MKKFFYFLLIPLFIFVFKLNSFAEGLSLINPWGWRTEDNGTIKYLYCYFDDGFVFNFCVPRSDGGLSLYGIRPRDFGSYHGYYAEQGSGTIGISATYLNRAHELYVPTFNSTEEAIDYYINYVPSSYDDSIGNDLLISLYKTQITDAAQRWQIRWFSDSINGQYGYDSVHVVIKGDTVVEFDSSDVNGYYWFSPLDVIDPEVSFDSKNIVCYVTPYLNGNWGNTKSITDSYSPALINVILDPFVDYFRSFSNGNGDVIGVDDFTVDTTPEKPDTSGTITNPTVINQTTFYSPVTRVENVSNITYVTQYIDNSSTTNTNQYSTINNINKTTEFNIDIDLSLDLSVGAPARFDAAKNYLDDAPNKFMSFFSVFEGTPLAPILTTLAGAIVVLVGAALVFVIIKIVGIIL